VSNAPALRTKAAVAIGGILLAIVVSLPEELLGQDAAGTAMLSGIVGLPALATAAIFGVQTWRAQSRQPSLDSTTVWFCRAPLLVFGLLVLAVLAAILSDL
jgi:hypothetical protein